MQCPPGLRSLGALHFPVDEISFTLEWVGGQAHFASRIVAIESRPIDIHTVRVKLTQAGQQFCPIITSRPHRGQPEGLARFDAVSAKSEEDRIRPDFEEQSATRVGQSLHRSSVLDRFTNVPAPIGWGEISVRQKPPDRSDWKSAAIAAR